MLVIDNIVKPISKAVHARKVIFLTADAFGVFPLVSKLTLEQAQYYILSGFTSKVTGNECETIQPQATFSACFGAAFLTLHPMHYVEILIRRMQAVGVTAYLVNTGWNGAGQRISIQVTRAIIDAILQDSMDQAECRLLPIFELPIPIDLPGINPRLLDPRNGYIDRAEWQRKANDLARLFNENFTQYIDMAAGKILSQNGPKPI